MTRRLANCVFVMLLVLSATVGTVAAQGRGRGGAAGPPARTASAPAMARGGGGAVARPPATAAHPNYNRPNTGPGSQFAVRSQQRQVIITTPPYYGYYGGYYGTGYYDPYPSYGWAPSYYGGAPYPSSYVEQTYVAPTSSQSEVNLSYQVDRLTREVERLRQDQADAALRQSLQPPPRAPEPPTAPITLVFRDGHRLSIQSYAVVRQTLWVVDERMSMRIDLSDLDLPATQQANLGRVLLLPVPAK